MNESASLLFSAPPTPYIVACGSGSYEEGGCHHNRTNIGVFDLIVVYRGTLHLGEGRNRWAVREGQSLILRPDLQHFGSAVCTEPTHFYWVHFQSAGHWEEKYGDYRNMRPAYEGNRQKNDDFTTYNYTIHIPKYYTLPFPAEAYGKLEKLIALDSMPMPSARWQQQSLFEDLLKEMHQEQVSTQDQRIPQLAEKTATYIRQNYRSRISNAALQDIFHFHANYICRCMRKVFGCTPLEYLLNYRIEQAKLLLLRTDWPVARIAEEVGFEHIPYFTRCFKKAEGLSPIQYRKKFTKGKKHIQQKRAMYL